MLEKGQNKKRSKNSFTQNRKKDKNFLEKKKKKTANKDNNNQIIFFLKSLHNTGINSQIKGEKIKQII